MTDAAAEPRTYGNWRKPQSAGLGKFGMLGTAVIFGGLIFTIVGLKVFGLIGAAAAAVPAGLVLLLLSRKDKHGFNWGQRLLIRFGSARSKRHGSNLYRSGPLGRTPWGRYQLPGVTARSRLWEATDSYGRPFALVHMPTTNHYTVVIDCQPDGAALVDQTQVDQWVAGWGQYLARLGGEPGIEGAACVVETAPDSGTRLRREVELHIDESAHPLAKQMLRETARTYPSNSSHIRAWITMTLKGVTPAGKRRTMDEVARDLQAKMPNWVSSVATTGGGAAHPVSAAELCEIVRTAYDPGSAELIEEAHARGDDVELDWSDVGPVAHETFHDAYRHDGAWSVTWAMTQPPRGLSYSDLLTRLLSPHGAVDRKRVTLLYRPVEPGIAAGIVEADKRNADFRVTAQSRPTARAMTDQKAAAATAQEEAKGAGLTNFGMVVTATVFNKNGLDEAKAAINNLSAGARILLRPQYGSQDSAFAAALPIGLIIPKHLKVPAIVREAAA